MSISSPATVAVIGARGIGRHHANWWTCEGARVTAFAATSPDTADAARRALLDSFGIDARPYLDIREMMAMEKPDIVDVCSPPACHADHTRLALEAGCHVLCEKPFVYDPAIALEACMDEARALFALADEKKLRLEVCTQYTMAAAWAKDLMAREGNGQPVHRIQAHIAAPAKGRPPDPIRVWSELAPHLISIVLVFAPDARIKGESMTMRQDGYTVEVTFEVMAEERAVEVKLQCGHTTGPPANIRAFTINNHTFNVEGVKGEDGQYAAVMDTPWGQRCMPDFMRLLIREYLAGRPIAHAQTHLDNLGIMYRALDARETV